MYIILYKILIYVYMHLLILLPYRISLMRGQGFKIGTSVVVCIMAVL